MLPDRPAGDPGTPDPAAAADAPAPTPPVGRRTVLAAGIPAVVGLLGMSALTSPRPADLGDPGGDRQLTRTLTPHLSGHRRVAVAHLDGSGGVRFAGFGADENTEFEIGSVSKTFTGALLAEAISRGEVTTRTTVAEVLGDGAASSEIADVTFAELAIHTSGLPRLAPGTVAGSFLASFLRKDPYAGRDADQVIADALACSPSGRGSFAYSNLGVALQGQLLARAAGTDFAPLLTQRILEPLGLGGTYAPITAENLRETATRGHGGSGLPQAPWTMNGSAPAGGIRSTAADLATYLAGTLDGSAPGAAAASEILVESSATEHHGMNWFHEDFGDGTWHTFHNGMTGGFAAFVGFTPATGRGIVILTDTARSVDALAVDILTGEVAL
ncbi:serine hydrolase [Brachybacterium vulturis]|uniref:Beta-lactamase n=1 Tax=Brachybacterium vulturis TaxID=2017484 RepID=A0A291GJG7_9MICO|nr:serine hydrolase domain-containing protein [Brachybacterium vulturis]ATG50351.1 serine hydrolase [Brachybacterium vulturis]